MNPSYPVRVEARLDEPLSRWLWLVKWLLALPHHLILAVLWFAYPFVGIAAFFAILVTGRYPRSLFEFTVGVLRWSFRVQYYSYAALGTDRYPPFTFGDVPEYPARLQVDYPPRLSRGLVLVKWWLLALPQLIIVGLFVGGGTWLFTRSSRFDFTWAAGGLIGILVLIAAIVLLFTGKYPRPLFDFVLGLDRWVLRVAAYVSLLTDRYPPFRLDLGGSEPSGPAPEPGPWTQPRPQATSTPSSTTTSTTEPGTEPATAPLVAPPPDPSPSGWSGGRIAAAVCGAVLVLISTGLISGGGALMWADRTQRDADGFFSGSAPFTTSGYALASDPVQLHGLGTGGPDLAAIVGDTRIRATAVDPAQAVFVGIAPAASAARYLAGVEHTTVTDFGDRRAAGVDNPGGALATLPQQAGIWTDQASGPGTQSVAWPVRDGDWTVVVMNSDGSRGVAVDAEAAATVPAIGWLSVLLIVVGVVFLVGGVTCVWLAARAAAAHRPAGEGGRAP
ncbi:DUF4389 domain-containing protein [Amycolatopsis rhabdoformis]|uniref:DUF4389 domain-containing protein n=1 Tax=Amycolatopsis rhabdoformis TaxID=1448059 RepID=A0ABZ1IGX4_9PSEU|nr:DUF4389 domain-containing protein [Amycolatopsis rhabdoformis]WSE33720.1 DUF4389 domain-containing protein [Amycolatopsis rhabdoformis]